MWFPLKGKGVLFWYLFLQSGVLVWDVEVSGKSHCLLESDIEVMVIHLPILYGKN